MHLTRFDISSDGETVDFYYRNDGSVPALNTQLSVTCRATPGPNTLATLALSFTHESSSGTIFGADPSHEGIGSSDYPALKDWFDQRLRVDVAGKITCEFGERTYVTEFYAYFDYQGDSLVQGWGN